MGHFGAECRQDFVRFLPGDPEVSRNRVVGASHRHTYCVEGWGKRGRIERKDTVPTGGVLLRLDLRLIVGPVRATGYIFPLGPEAEHRIARLPSLPAPCIPLRLIRFCCKEALDRILLPSTFPVLEVLTILAARYLGREERWEMILPERGIDLSLLQELLDVSRRISHDQYYDKIHFYALLWLQSESPRAGTVLGFLQSPGGEPDRQQIPAVVRFSWEDLPDPDDSLRDRTSRISRRC